MTLKELIEEVWWHGEKYGTGLVYEEKLGKDEMVAKTAKLIAKDIEQYIIGDDYIFDRPRHDYLPNVVRHIEAKNELRQTQRQALKKYIGE